MKNGILLVLSGPSGAGKGTLSAKLLEDDPTFRFSVSCTTRAPREGEVHGRHYYFVDEKEFESSIQKRMFLEHAVVHGYRYGTLRTHVMERIERGYNVLLEIDPQGARAVMDAAPDCVSVFILPPSYEELATRLHTRNTDKPAEIQRRLFNARGEIAQMGLYHYIIVNDTLDSAYAQLSAIVTAEKHRSTRYRPEIPESAPHQ